MTELKEQLIKELRMAELINKIKEAYQEVKYKEYKEKRK